MASSHGRIGEILSQQQSPASAVRAYERALEIVAALSSEDPADARLRSGL